MLIKDVRKKQCHNSIVSHQQFRLSSLKGKLGNLELWSMGKFSNKH